MLVERLWWWCMQLLTLWLPHPGLLQSLPPNLLLPTPPDSLPQPYFVEKKPIG